MTFNPDAEIQSGNTRSAGGGGGMLPRGGGGGRIALGGGGGCLLLVIVIVFALMGGNPMDLLGGGSTQTGAASSGEGGALEQCSTGEDANTDDKCLVQGVVESADSLWAQLGPDSGIEFREPQAVVFSDQVQTGCGAATSDVGPFYCPADQTIYVDDSFFGDLQSRFGADGGPFAKMYVVAHEYGHHIQNLSGTMSKVDHQETGPQSGGVRLELQADCYAGVWANHASTTTDDNGVTMLQPLTDQDIQSALSAASAVGDDHIQGDVSGGQVQPETWTHGSSEQRQNWFMTGYQEGTVEACDTFGAESV
ncbi:neutral zinc metallopeptidase [Brachybacterium sp. NBEC-018]|uniref:KPN_02809 family neutral zinc metallopeptidase n=1 Tax=Brachybacterium sp. NBEC-018 TaxID=2996004 RepID=UPI0021750EE1|nr:neutral zinc metallopeptidase [Brachybacterium sp. NBEC-018]UVY85254.1 neutral zinc metallopeptidase [Brachybacterium sp. NBEC-018]